MKAHVEAGRGISALLKRENEIRRGGEEVPTSFITKQREKNNSGEPSIALPEKGGGLSLEGPKTQERRNPLIKMRREGIHVIFSNL